MTSQTVVDLELVAARWDADRCFELDSEFHPFFTWPEAIEEPSRGPVEEISVARDPPVVQASWTSPTKLRSIDPSAGENISSQATEASEHLSGQATESSFEDLRTQLPSEAQPDSEPHSTFTTNMFFTPPTQPATTMTPQSNLSCLNDLPARGSSLSDASPPIRAYQRFLAQELENARQFAWYLERQMSVLEWRVSHLESVVQQLTCYM
ncbi:hypothetical protein SMMN14_03187 [Sphaerulina musiva]